MEIENFVPCKPNQDEIYDYINNNIMRIDKSHLEKFEQGAQIIFYRVCMDNFITLDIKTMYDRIIDKMEGKNQKIQFLELYQYNFDYFQFLNLHDDFKKNVLKSDISYKDFLNGDPKKIKQFLVLPLINFHKFRSNFTEKDINLLKKFENSHSKLNQIFFSTKTKNKTNIVSFKIEKKIVFKKIERKGFYISKKTKENELERTSSLDALKLEEALQKKQENKTNELVI